MRTLLSQNLLYGIVDTAYVPEKNFLEKLQQLASGGVRVVQFRAKGWEKERVLEACLSLAPAAAQLGVCFIVNDYPDIALRSGAAGVHVGQEDGSLAEVRALVGEEMIVGRSTHSYEQAMAAYAEGFDYIGFGPLFPTQTKPGRPAIGTEDIARVHEDLPREFPVFCIGGVEKKNLRALKALGVKRAVVVSWLLQQEDSAVAAEELMSLLQS